MRAALISGALIVLAAGGAMGDAALVIDGKPAAVIVTADQPSAVATYAARELTYHVARATGATLSVHPESAVPEDPATRVFVGPCDASRAAGIDAAGLAREACVLRSVDGALYVTGEDEGADPLSVSTRAGTLWGVYELLERCLKVRWLWPGEVGTWVPASSSVTIPDLDETIVPALEARGVRSGAGLKTASDAGFTPEDWKQYLHDQSVFLRRHRMGRSKPMRYGHAFNGWWQEYGGEHPEWFQLLEDGNRGPRNGSGNYSMCVSDPGLHKHIVDGFFAARANSTEPPSNINCCENDVFGLCTCANCTAWDGPQPESIAPRYGPHVVSDRYARFYGAVQKLAALRDPETEVIGYGYVNYYPAPSAGIDLGPKVMVGLVPDTFFPRSERDHQWVRDQWSGWARTGARLFLRPNYFLEGYCMPHIFAHQFADEFQAAAREGMFGTDFDSLTGQWATQGTNLYVLMRLHRDPLADVDEILGEYYAGFGPAGGPVKAYFDYWEDYTTRNRELFAEIALERGANWPTYAKVAHERFPDECWAKAEGYLARARQAALGQEEFSARVRILELGLEHAKLCAQVAAVVGASDSDVPPMRWHSAREKLKQFRRVHGSSGFTNLNYCAWNEARSWRLTDGYTGEPLRIVSEQPGPLEDEPIFATRGTHMFVALLDAGERFEATIACRQIGRFDSDTLWRLYGPDEKLLEEGEIQRGTSGRVTVAAVQDGVHLLLVKSGGNAASVSLLSDHVSMAARSARLLGQSSPMFFYVPDGTEQFSVKLSSPAPGETAEIVLLGPDGTEHGRAATGHQKKEVQVTVAPAVEATGKAWCVVPGKAPTGVLEDYVVTLGDGLPGYFSQAADRLVTTKQNGLP